uniref:Uncharacterized protein n=1 Tax=Caenorhabditis japonica TaxID=281687 RepID=A0A8R1HUJ8_CAEJA
MHHRPRSTALFKFQQCMSQLDTLAATVSTAQEENSRLNEQLEVLKAKISTETGNSQEIVENLRATIVTAQQENSALKEQFEVEKNQKNADIETLRSEIAQYQQENASLKEQAQQSSQNQSSTEELSAAIAQLQHENEYLKQVAKTHHDENVKYYEQCQAMAAQNQTTVTQMEQLHARIQELDSKITTDSDTHEKRAKELQRLREHLMIVEENSTREAVESEQRETELRARVRELEARGHAAEEGATESTQQYQVKIASLTSQMESLQRSGEQWRGKYESEVKAREQTQEALSSLQNVVRELSVDHERDAATASHRNLELQTQIGEHLREALDANLEKSTECENLKDKANNLEREVELRQNCVDEMIAQTNTLQMQQEAMSHQNKQLQTAILANERLIVQLGEELKEGQLRHLEMEVKVKRLEDVIVGNSEEENEGESSSSADTNSLKRYIGELQSKLADTEEELKKVKSLKEDDDKETAQVRQVLERSLFEAEQVDRGLLEGIEVRVREMESELIAKCEQLEQVNTERRRLEMQVLELTGKIETMEKEEQGNRESNEKLKAEVEEKQNELDRMKENCEFFGWILEFSR